MEYICHLLNNILLFLKAFNLKNSKYFISINELIFITPL